MSGILAVLVFLGMVFGEEKNRVVYGGDDPARDDPPLPPLGKGGRKELPNVHTTAVFLGVKTRGQAPLSQLQGFGIAKSLRLDVLGRCPDGKSGKS